jgi:hypothetical protein
VGLTSGSFRSRFKAVENEVQAEVELSAEGFSLADTAEALRQMAAGTLAGKTAIVVRENAAHR